jgi:AcrR family transcriptional regulator
LGQIRDTERTRQRILNAATKEFIQKGFDGATLFGIAQRARISKQLIHHHFRSKNGLFQEVLEKKFRPMLDFEESIPSVTSDLLAERFKRRSAHGDYVRFLTWEAASGHRGALPGHEIRQQRISGYAETLKLMQAAGRLPKDLDHRLLQLAIFSLSTYPMAFGQITRLVTGLSPNDRRFQKKWYAFLRKIGKRLFK